MAVFVQRFLSIGVFLCYIAFSAGQTTESSKQCEDPVVGDFVQVEQYAMYIATLRCTDGLLPYGNNTSVCEYDEDTGRRIWIPSPSDFVCYANCTGVEIRTQPSVIVQPCDLNEGPYQSLYLECPEYYTSSGQSQHTCIYKNDTQQSIWDPDPYEFKCHAPCNLNVTDNNIKTSPDRSVHNDGDEVTFSCMEGGLVGTETSRCDNGQWTPHVDVRCDLSHGQLRLKNGRVMVKYNGEEGSVCFTTEWDIHNANVVCRQLGLRPYAVATRSISFSEESNDLVHFDTVRCQGYEKMLIDCGLMWFSSCDTRAYAGVICLEGDESASEDSVRLVNPHNQNDESSGRVEIYQGGQWRSICKSGWTLQNGHVVCRQLGYTKAINIVGNYGIGDGANNTIHFLCQGSESSLRDCSNGHDIPGSCDGVGAAVVCQLPDKHSLRLINGTDSAGRLEIFDGAYWRTVSAFTDEITPQLICDKIAVEGSYRTYTTNGDFGNGLVAPKYAFTCDEDAENLDACQVVDVSGDEDVEQPVSLYCDKDKSTMNPQLIMMVAFLCASAVVIFAFIIRSMHHKKRVTYRRSMATDPRYGQLEDQEKDASIPLNSDDQRTGSDSVFTD